MSVLGDREALQDRGVGDRVSWSAILERRVGLRRRRLAFGVSREGKRERIRAVRP